MDNHVFKLMPMQRDPKGRYHRSRAEALKRLGKHRRVREFIEIHEGTTLGDEWWARSYLYVPRAPGKHLANRAMALSTALVDLLLLGDPVVDKLLPGPVAFAEQLAPEARTTEQQAALGLFMLSHFLADATVPCHCDGRALTSTKVCGFHTQFEDHWGDIVGKRFHKKSLLQQSINRAQAADDLMALARGVDSRLGDPFTALAIPRVAARDLWDETVNICWGSFVVNGIVVPPSKIPYDSRLTTTRRKALSGRAGVGQDLDRAVLHDAVLNVAIAWKNLWRQASKVGKKKTGGS